MCACVSVCVCVCVCAAYTRLYLEEGGDGKSGNAPVRVRDEVLQVHIAGGDSVRMDHGYTVQGLHSRETDGRL